MPISFAVAKHPAQSHPETDGKTANGMLVEACKDQATKSGEILQFSCATGEGITTVDGRDMNARIHNIVPSQNGFVATLLEAYTKDRALVIRPDDVWIAILSQFNFYVCAHAELLRASFVAHEGTRELTIDARPSTRYQVDFGALAQQMAGLVDKNVVDPSLCAWALPSFSTTTPNDTTVSAALLMATLKHYFTYRILMGGCGIPRVTLEGEKGDWVDILGRLEKLKEYGLETTAWYHLLRPVLARFVAAFDAPASAENVDFWQRIAHYEPGGSGRGDEYTGWITAFMVFSKDGAWLGNRLHTNAQQDAAALTSAQFWSAYTRPDVSKKLVLDSTPYHSLQRGAVPPGYGEVDIKLVDDNVVFNCSMVAGTIGMRVSSSGDRALSESGEDDTVQPVAGWWMFVKDEKRMQERAKEAFKDKHGYYPWY
ncbi:hypothetical protein C8R43DRAFT_696662 [Mycena crocata]|nr:hypothetical protein C8R43DRAFT_696662 [Mycena crocata]